MGAKVIRCFEGNLSRGRIILFFSILAVIFFILFVLTEDDTEGDNSKDEKTSTQQQLPIDQKVKGQSFADQTSQTEEEFPEQNTQTEIQGVKVTKVIDGDTIEIENGQRIRYIGIDTPETVNPSGIVDCYGRQASNKNKELVGGKVIRFEKDISETDKYGRLLRYVFVDDIFVNEYLVRQGFASASSYPPDVKYQNQLKDAEREAIENNRGFWGSCQPDSQSSQSPINTDGNNCDPSYPTICIGPEPPDLDCGDIIYRRFKVIPPDPHNFDVDRDGAGCESI